MWLKYEAEAYQIQYSISHSFPGGRVFSLSDINENSVLEITNADGNKLYKK